jgi:hypothetical protein
VTVSTPTSGGQFEISDEGVLVRGSSTKVLVLSVDGQYVWSLTPDRDGHPADRGTMVPWPNVLTRFLNGSATVTIADYDGEVLHEEKVVLGTGEGTISIVDGGGNPLSVDKVGHLTRSFEATDTSIREEILDGTQRVLADLRDVVGVEAYLNYGALLGAIREGRMLGHDSDTDVCYLSKHTVPADIITESYAIERTMRERGWSILRMSGGDIKVLHEVSDGRKVHIDIFVAFYVPDKDGEPVFYQLGNRSGRLRREAIVPVSTITLHGYDFPAPAEPEEMLAFIYGPKWRTPDPSFKYADPPAGVRRLDGWLRGFRTDMGQWTEFHSTHKGELETKQSAFGAWVLEQLPEDAKVVDIGSGAIGRDGRFFARKGHQVHSVDFSRAAVAAVRRRAERHDLPLVSDQLILGELRSTLTLGARLARDPHHLYARDLLGCLDDAARSQLWTLAKMALRPGGGKLYLEFAVTGENLPEPQPEGLVRRIDPDLVQAEIEAAGGVVEHLGISDGEDMLGNPLPGVARLRASWPTLNVAEGN